MSEKLSKKLHPCPECGRKLSDRDTFCSKCGRKKDSINLQIASVAVEIPHKYSKRAFTAVNDAWRIFRPTSFRIIILCIVIGIVNFSLNSPSRFAGCTFPVCDYETRSKYTTDPDITLFFLDYGKGLVTNLHVKWLCELNSENPMLLPKVFLFKIMLPIFFIPLLVQAGKGNLKIKLTMKTVLSVAGFAFIKLLLFSITYTPVYIVINSGTKDDNKLIIAALCFFLLTLYVLYFLFARLVLVEPLIFHRNMGLFRAIKVSLMITYRKRITILFFMLKAMLFLKIVAYSSFFFDIFGFADGFFNRLASIGFYKGYSPDEIPVFFKFVIWLQGIGPSIPGALQHVLSIVISAFCIAVIVVVYRDCGGLEAKKKVIEGDSA